MSPADKLRELHRMVEIEEEDNVGRTCFKILWPVWRKMRSLLPDPDEVEAYIDMLEAEKRELAAALKHIAFIGTDCAAADDPQSFYYGQLCEAIATAARALTRLEQP